MSKILVNCYYSLSYLRLDQCVIYLIERAWWEGEKSKEETTNTFFFIFFLAAETLRSAYSHHQRDVKVVQKLALSASTKALASSLSIFLLFAFGGTTQITPCLLASSLSWPNFFWVEFWEFYEENESNSSGYFIYL